MKYYFGIELAALALLTAFLLSVQAIGGLWVVVPFVVVGWVILQLVSSAAFCNAISKGDIAVSREALGSKEIYRFATGRKSGWLVMRHVWAYRLIAEPSVSPPARTADR